MSYTSWRGVVGLIKPGYRPGSLEEIIRLLPEGIGVIPLYLDEGIKEGTQKELLDAMEPIKEKVAKLAALKVDLIHPMGAPPFILRGYRGEEEIIKNLEDKHGIPRYYFRHDPGGGPEGSGSKKDAGHNILWG